MVILLGCGALRSELPLRALLRLDGSTTRCHSPRPDIGVCPDAARVQARAGAGIGDTDGIDLPALLQQAADDRARHVAPPINVIFM